MALTAAQQALASDPKHILLARRLAKQFYRRLRGSYDWVLSAAFLGLCRAAENFDPDCQVKFESFATYRIIGQIKDDARMTALNGFRRSQRRDDREPPTIHQFAVEISPDVEFNEYLMVEDNLDDEGVQEIAKLLRQDEREVVVLFFTRADCQVMRLVGERMGFTESAISLKLRNAFARLRKMLDEKGGPYG